MARESDVDALPDVRGTREEAGDAEVLSPDPEVVRPLLAGSRLKVAVPDPERLPDVEGVREPDGVRDPDGVATRCGSAALEELDEDEAPPPEELDDELPPDEEPPEEVEPEEVGRGIACADATAGAATAKVTATAISEREYLSIPISPCRPNRQGGS